MKTKKGFTLSEVLITLTLIGIITALVVPSIITRTGFTKKIVAFKKAYNTMSGAYSQAVANSTAEFHNLRQLTDALTKYLNIKYYYADKEGGGVEIASSHGVGDTPTNGSATNWMVTEDGIAYKITQNIDEGVCSRNKTAINTAETLDDANPCYTIEIDIDGIKKGDNAAGEVSLDDDEKIDSVTGDLFTVFISKTGVTAGNPGWSPAAKIMEFGE